MHRLHTEPAFKAYRDKYKRKHAAENPEHHAELIVRTVRVTRWHVRMASVCSTEARRHGYSCDVTPDYIMSLWAKQKGLCHWLGIQMVPSIIRRYPLRPSLDKLVPSLGYTRGNVVLSTFFANMGRNAYPADDFALFVVKLRSVLPR